MYLKHKVYTINRLVYVRLFQQYNVLFKLNTTCIIELNQLYAKVVHPYFEKRVTSFPA